MTKGEQGVGAYTFEGVTKLVAHVPREGYGDFRGWDGAASTVEPEKDVFAPVYSLRNMILIISVVAAMVIAAFAIVIARSIANPMIKGVAFAKAVASW